MAKAKAEPWLREAFRDGVDAYTLEDRNVTTPFSAPYPGVFRGCWLAYHDPARRPCEGSLERFHFIRRQDVETAMWEQLWDSQIVVVCSKCRGAGLLGGGIVAGDLCPRCAGHGRWQAAVTTKLMWELILLAAWDPRNGGHACEQHHRRYDGHQVSLPRDRVIVPYSALPSRVVQFGFDYSEGRLLDRFPSSI